MQRHTGPLRFKVVERPAPRRRAPVPRGYPEMNIERHIRQRLDQCRLQDVRTEHDACVGPDAASELDDPHVVQFLTSDRERSKGVEDTRLIPERGRLRLVT